jgi:hypothetical protein
MRPRTLRGSSILAWPLRWIISFHFASAYFLHFIRWKRLDSQFPSRDSLISFGLVYHRLISFFRLYIHGSISGTGHILILSVWETVQWTGFALRRTTRLSGRVSFMYGYIIYKKNILVEEWNEKSLRLGRFGNTFPNIVSSSSSTTARAASRA